MEKIQFFSLFGELAKRYGFKTNPVINLQIAHSKELIHLTQKTETKQKEIQDLMIQVKDRLGLNLKTSHMDVDQFQARVMLAMLFCNKRKKRRLKTQFLTLQKLKERRNSLNDLKDRISEVSRNFDSIRSVFVTFQQIKHKQFFKRLMARRGCVWLPCLKTMSEGMIKIGGRRVYAVDPPEPINIRWKNYSYTKCNKFWRRTLSWSFYIFLYILRKVNFISIQILKKCKNQFFKFFIFFQNFCFF